MGVREKITLGGDGAAQRFCVIRRWMYKGCS